MTETADYEFRAPSKDELALVVKTLRDTRGWTQETLAELAGLSVRTIQRLEDGQGAGSDTLRAIARALEARDLDFLLRPQKFPTEAGMKRQKEAFDRENMLIDARPLAGGRALEAFMVGINMLCCVEGEIPDDDQASLEEAALLFDYLKDYLDIKSEIGHQDRLSVIAELDAVLGRLRAAGWSPVVGVRDAALSSNTWVDKTPWKVKIGYLTLLPIGATPAKLAVARAFRLD